MADYENKIIEAIQTIVDNAVANAGYDKTIIATVIDCVDATIAKYKVRYQNSTFYAYANSSEVTYTRGSEVYILVPSSDMSRDKTILGTTKKLGVNYAVAAEGEEAYEQVGINCIDSPKVFELNSYRPQTIEVYNHSKTSNLINLDEKSVNEYIKQSSSIICGGTFKTDLPVEQQFRGNFGIIFELAFLDNASTNEVMRSYVVDVNQMEGNPYKISNWKRQYGVFEIDGANFKYINKISIFNYDFPNNNDSKPIDIWIKDLEFCGSKALTEEDLLNCCLTFITPQGVYFDDTNIDSDIKTLQAQVRVKGKIIDNESQRLDFYWFRENVGITSSSSKYNKYGGQGWECLNLSNTISTSPLVVEWVPGSYKFTIAKKDAQALDNRYKCVVIYDNTVLTKEIIVKNYDSGWDISIESDQGNKFYFDIGNPTLSCIVKKDGQIINPDALTYNWAEEDNNGNYTGMAETTSENTEYSNAAAGYKALQDGIKAETILAAAAQQDLDNYLTIMKKYDTITRVEKNKIIHLGINTITNFSTYRCSVYNNGTYIGTNSIVIINSLESEGNYSLVINDGSQVFKYNESGISPASNSLENPVKLAPLTFTLYDNLGQPIDTDVIKHSDIEWIIPTKNTLIEISNGYGEPDSVDLINNTESYKGYLGITYNIKERYDIKKVNNNIKLKVDYKGNTFTAETNFTFTKEGEPGTNGTDFICKIVPNTNNDDYNLIPMMTTKNNVVTMNYTPKNSGKYFRVQLWHNGERIFNNTETGATTENKNAVVTWSILRNKYSTSILDNSNIDINATTGKCTLISYENDSQPANIIQCTIKYDNITYYATLPVVAAKVTNDYTIEWKENTGFKFATYTSDGRDPKYDNSNPFELKITNLINGYKEDISELSSNNNKVNYTWNVVGKIYNPSTKTWDNKDNLIINKSITGLKRNQYAIKPIDEYNGECLNNGLECVITNNSNAEVARIHIPVHLMLNRYGNAAINGWNGNSVSIDENGSGVILAPQVGAGKKESDNSFTGVLMGEVKESGASKSDIGFIGYAKGKRSIFLDAETGKSIFGTSGKGQIIIDPTSNKAQIYSGNYNTTNKTGMLIDLTTPEIKFGSGNFTVNADGYLTAKGGGEIAGWKIGDTKLYSAANASGSNPKITIDSSIAAIYSNNKDSMISTKNGFYIGSDGFALGTYNSSKGHNPFQVNNEGSLFSNSGSIGGYTIADNTLSGGSGSNAVGMSSLSGVQWAFWAGAENAGDAPFHVGHNGSLYASKGVIAGWSIGTDKLSGGSMNINANGSMSGPNWSINANGYATFSNVAITNGATNSISTIDFGKFTVNTAGSITSTSGKIGGWNIGTGSLSGGGVSLSSRGQVNIVNGGYYFKMGVDTNHPEVSGLNVGSGGINMNGNGISSCSIIGVNTIGTYNSGVVHVNTALYADSTLYYKGYDGNYHQVAGLYDWYSGGATYDIECLAANGNHKWNMHFSHGLLVKAEYSKR